MGAHERDPAVVDPRVPSGEDRHVAEPLIPPGPSAAPPEVSALVKAAREGDRAAFGRLHELFSRLVHAILLARVPRSEADDLVQDVFLAALSELHVLRDGAMFGSWIATIARNRASDFRRRGRKLEALPDDLARASAPSAEAEEVLAMIRSLPEAYSETLLLRLVEGMTGPEIAERTGLTPASVRVNLHRGMKLLRKKLGLPQGQEVEDAP
jgi:RNA polymerase sigma-70 factor (ECF subfamily)